MNKDKNLKILHGNKKHKFSIINKLQMQGFTFIIIINSTKY